MVMTFLRMLSMIRTHQTANLDFDDLTVAALAPPITGLTVFIHVIFLIVTVTVASKIRPGQKSVTL